MKGGHRPFVILKLSKSDLSLLSKYCFMYCKGGINGEIQAVDIFQWIDDLLKFTVSIQTYESLEWFLME